MEASGGKRRAGGGGLRRQPVAAQGCAAACAAPALLHCVCQHLVQAGHAVLGVGKVGDAIVLRRALQVHRRRPGSAVAGVLDPRRLWAQWQGACALQAGASPMLFGRLQAIPRAPA